MIYTLNFKKRKGRRKKDRERDTEVHDLFRYLSTYTPIIVVLKNPTRSGLKVFTREDFYSFYDYSFLNIY